MTFIPIENLGGGSADKRFYLIQNGKKKITFTNDNSKGSLTERDGYVEFHRGSGSYTGSMMCYTEDIIIKNFTSLKFISANQNANRPFAVCKYLWEDVFICDRTTSQKEYTIDVSKYQGQTIKFNFDIADDTGYSAYVYDMWLE